VPVATVLMAWAGLVKLTSRGPGDSTAQSRTSTLLAVAAALNTIGYTLVMEGPDVEGYGHAKCAFWHTLRSLKSNANHDLAIWTFYVCFTAMVALVIVFILRARRPQSAEGGGLALAVSARSAAASRAVNAGRLQNRRHRMRHEGRG
jgi:hypothetical protein